MTPRGFQESQPLTVNVVQGVPDSERPNRPERPWDVL